MLSLSLSLSLSQRRNELFEAERETTSSEKDISGIPQTCSRGRESQPYQIELVSHRALARSDRQVHSAQQVTNGEKKNHLKRCGL